MEQFCFNPLIGLCSNYVIIPWQKITQIFPYTKMKELERETQECETGSLWNMLYFLETKLFAS